MKIKIISLDRQEMLSVELLNFQLNKISDLWKDSFLTRLPCLRIK